MVKRAEEKLNVKLPDLFIELLKIRNGGYTRGFVFPTHKQTSWSDNHVPFDEMFGIDFSNTIESEQSIMDSPYLTSAWGLPEKQVILSGDGHWWITLDYRAHDYPPAVAWIDTEMEQDIQLADSFDEFMNALITDEDFENSVDR
jgi:hypothetical protein